MPRWARFLSCTFTGLLLSVAGVLVAAYWYEGGGRFWVDLFDFFATPAFWSLIWLFVLLAAFSLLAGRVFVAIYGMADGVAGLLGGGLVAMAYASFLVASQAPDWGGFAASLGKAWPASLYFAAPFALAGGVTTWLWDRLG